MDTILDGVVPGMVMLIDINHNPSGWFHALRGNKQMMGVFAIKLNMFYQTRCADLRPQNFSHTGYNRFPKFSMLLDFEVNGINLARNNHLSGIQEFTP